MEGIGAFRGFMRARLNIEPDSLLKSTKVSCILIGSNSLSRDENLAAVMQVTQAVVRGWVEDWVGFKELRLESKFLNRGL